MDDHALTIGFALARALHIGACLILLCVPVFDQLFVHPLPRSARDLVAARWKAISLVLAVVASAVALVSGAAWLSFVAITMSGLPARDALQRDTLLLVWSQTHFGRLWELRSIFWLAGTAFLLAHLSRNARPRVSNSPLGSQDLISSVFGGLAVIAGGCLVASLAWSGHGQTGPHESLHLASDVIHLLISGVWPAGLLPFALMLLYLRRQFIPASREVISLLTRRFSAVSLICVSILIGSGAINSLPLVGAIHNLWLTDYGRLLLIKIFLAYLMVALGAMNLRCWKPRLLLDSEGNMQGNRDHAAKKLQQNVMMEIALACLVVLVVGLLGLLPPASEHSHHAHDPSSVEARPLAPSSN